MGRDDYGRSSTWDRNTLNSPINTTNDVGSNVEMEPLTGTGSSFPRSGGDKMALLNECKEIREQGLTTINALIAQIESTQRSILSSADSRYTESQTLALEDTRSELIEVFRTWTKRVQALKSHPEANSGMNKGQIATVAGQITAARDRYNAVGVSFKKKSDEQTARQYRIVMGEGATDADIQDAMEDPNQNVFAQALMTSTRQGQAQSTLSAVKQRSEAIKQIESQMIELGDLFEQMNTLVEQQEAAVTQIEMKGEEVVENMSKGTEQIGVAIESARNTRKWKWWCLGICGKNRQLATSWITINLIQFSLSSLSSLWYSSTNSSFRPQSPRQHQLPPPSASFLRIRFLQTGFQQLAMRWFAEMSSNQQASLLCLDSHGKTIDLLFLE